MENSPVVIKLGIDAKWYFDGPPSGNMVVKNLVNQMVKSHYGFKLYLFFTSTHRHLAKNHFPASVKTIFLPAIPNILSNMFLVPVIARRYRIDAMLFQNFNSFWPRGLLKIAYIHDVLFLDYPQYYTKTEQLHFNQMKYSAASANLVITISESEKTRLIENDVASEETIAVVHHGINRSFKTLASYKLQEVAIIRAKYNLPNRYLLFVGRVNIRKNLSNLINALCWLDDRDIKLIVVGEASELNAGLLKLINANNLAGRVQFTGHVPEADLHLIYANAFIFCFPSYAEGFGLPPLEAMQCGIPVIVSNRTAMPEVCGDAAVYIEPDNPLDIAKQINLLLNNRLYYMGKVAAGIEHSKNFTWEKSADSVLTLITQAYDHSKNYSEA